MHSGARSLGLRPRALRRFARVGEESEGLGRVGEAAAQRENEGEGGDRSMSCR